MDKTNRFTFIADDETLAKLDAIKRDDFYDRPWSDVCLNILKLGLESYESKKEK